MKKIIITLSAALCLFINMDDASLTPSHVNKGNFKPSTHKIPNTHRVYASKNRSRFTSNTIHSNEPLVSSKPIAQIIDVKPIKHINVLATAYNANCKNCSGITATGLDLKKNPNLKVISVDPKVIKLGTKVYVEGYGYAIAGDTGKAIKGNRIDVFFPSVKDDLSWGRKIIKVDILN